MKLLLYLIAATLLALAQTALAADPCPPQSHLLEPQGKGTVDWTYYAVTVPLPPGPGLQNDPLARQEVTPADTACRGAISNLLEIISGLRLDAGHLVRDRIAADPLIKAQLEEIVTTAARLVSNPAEALRFRLKGAFLQLILPEEIKQLAEIQTVAPPGTGDSKTSDPQPFSGVVIDALAIDTAPALVPTVVDENGRQVYGPPFVSREFAVQYGCGIYAPCMNETVKQRVGQRPLVIRALRAVGPSRSTLVISNGDASSLRSASSHLSLLRQAKVAILVRESQPRQIEGKP